MQEVFEKIIKKLEEQIKEYDDRIERRKGACHFDETENMRKLDDRAKGIEQAVEIVRQAAAEYKDFDMEFAKKCVELAGKMNVCDLVSENCRLSRNNRFLEAELEIAKRSSSGWIPCSERLPENDDEVLVWFEYFRYGNYNRLFQTIGISYMYDGRWSGFVNGQSGWSELKIIAWQHLPDPYHPEGE